MNEFEKYWNNLIITMNFHGLALLIAYLTKSEMEKKQCLNEKEINYIEKIDNREKMLFKKYGKLFLYQNLKDGLNG